MLKILIVNSKKSSIENMKNIIYRRNYDFNITGVCQDTTSAINVIKMSDIHLVICEANSENINSALIMSESERLMKQTRFIITGDVSDPTSILNAQLMGYLPEPVQSMELYTLLDKAKNLSDSRNLNLHYMYFSYLGNLYQGENSFYGMYMRRSDAARVTGENYYYITVSADQSAEEYTSGKSASYDQIENFMFVKLINFVGDELGYSIFKESLAEYGIVVSSQTLRMLSMTIYEYALAVKSLFYENNLNISVLVGRSVESPNWLYKSKESIQALKIMKFYSGTGVILHYDQMDNVTFSAMLSDPNIKSALVNSVIDGNEKEIIQAMGVLFKECSDKLITIDCFKTIISDIIKEISDHITELGGDIKNINYRHIPTDKLNDMTLDIVKVSLTEFAVKSNEYIKTLAKNDGVDIVNAIYEYIKTNYNEDISLAHFAKKHFINVSYLGQIFKKHIGLSFNEYLMATRIQEAKKLLVNNKKIKVHEIAQKVGFKDANYFCMKFKLAEGITPTKYRLNSQ